MIVEIRSIWVLESIAVPLVVLVNQLVELLEVQALVAVCFVVYVDRMQHLQNVFVSDVVAGHTRKLLEFVIVDIVVFIIIEMTEDNSQTLLGFYISDFWGYDGNKFLEIDCLFVNPETLNYTVDEGVFS